MTTTQRQRPPRQSAPTPDPAYRGLILVAVAVALGVVLLIQGGGVGFDRDTNDVEIGTAADGQPVETTTTTPPPPQTTVAPADLQIAALNAAGINGYAGRAQQFLGVAGYTSVTPITAAALAEQTIVHYLPGFEVDAMMIAQLFELQPNQVQPMPEGDLASNPEEFPENAGIAVVLAPDVSTTVEGAAANAAPEDPAAGGATGDTATDTGT